MKVSTEEHYKCLLMLLFQNESKQNNEAHHINFIQVYNTI